MHIKSLGESKKKKKSHHTIVTHTTFMSVVDRSLLAREAGTEVHKDLTEEHLQGPTASGSDEVANTGTATPPRTTRGRLCVHTMNVLLDLDPEHVMVSVDFQYTHYYTFKFMSVL